MEKTVICKRFQADRYGMVYCPGCKGSGKLFDGVEGEVVCKVFGGFGLIKKQEKDSPDANGYNPCLSRALQNERG